MRSRHRKVFGAAACASSLLVLALSGPADADRRHAPLQGEGEGLELIANIPYDGGTDMELLTRNGRDYAITGSESMLGDGGMRVIDVTDPAEPKVVAFLRCVLRQNDVQISHDQKTVMLAQDATGRPDACLAFGKRGFMTVDITNIKKPRPIGFAENPDGSHNTTAHPTKPYVYNSSSGERLGPVHIWSIKNPARPKLVGEYRPLGSAPHDISFNKDGSLAVLAGDDQNIEVLDTSDPEAPTLLTVMFCVDCQLTHDAKFTPDSRYIVVGDEARGGQPFPCPGGALHFYEIQGTKQQPVLVMVGVYEPNEILFATDQLNSCTSHVFDISDDGTRLAISWYSAGTRYLDISNMQGIGFGTMGPGPHEIGWFVPENGDSWSSKLYKGPYIYSNDLNRGFDVYRITAE
ncbi:MAG: LVIVD repeat-containing protein [Actinomycetota bacterium]